jgi:hypothetical protein
MGQKRRFERRELEQMLRAEGLEVEQVWQLNKAAAPLWWLNSKALGRSRLSKVSLKIFDKTIWLWRLLDKVLPWNGLSLLMVARKRAA